jgi:hypothetical protein
VWRAASQLVMARESEKAASPRCGERMRIFMVSDEVYAEDGGLMVVDDACL